MTKEVDIRNNFFASVDEADVARYKAILPIYWKNWSGEKNPTGYVVKLKNIAEIKAPSERETFEIFKGVLDEAFPNQTGRGLPLKDLINEYYGTKDDVDTLALKHFHKYALNWNNVNDEITKSMFDRVKKLGYNAIPDMNDANNLSESPYIFFNKKAFEIVGHETHGLKEIKEAQKQIRALVHALFIFGKHLGVRMVTDEEVETFLQHYGVKGMRWGVRKNSSTSSANSAVKKDRKEISAKRRLISDADLDKYVSRLEKEKKLKTLIEDDLSPGKRAVKMLMSDVGKNSMRAVGTGLAIYGVRAALVKKFDVKEAVQYLKPKK
jgi:hypothetical protein